MKKLSLITILLFSLIICAFAQDKESDIKKLFELMKTEEMTEKFMDTMLPLVRQQISESIPIPAEEKEEALEEHDRMMKETLEETKLMLKKLMDEDMAAIYDKHFTHAEILDLISYYESPTGQKFLEKSPEITKEIFEIMMMKHLPNFRDKMDQRMEEKKK